MRIKKLSLHTNKLLEQLNFYTNTLGLTLLEKSASSFTIEVGWSQLTFKESKEAHNYHFCFLIPSNKLHEALQWLGERTAIVEIEPSRNIENSPSWNADSIYFYDKGGNIAEFITHYDLNNPLSSDFNSSHILCVNEIGLPTSNISETNEILSNNLGTQFWKGNMERFGTNGNPEGLILLPNFQVKELWFPTEIKTTPTPFTAEIEQESKLRIVKFNNNKLLFN